MEARGKKSNLFIPFIFVSVFCSVIFILNVKMASAANTDTYFYYSSGRKITLPLSKEILTVRFKPEATLDKRQTIVDSQGNLSSFSQRKDIPIPKITLLPLQQNVTEESAVQTITNFNSDENIEFANPVFDFPDAKLTLTDEFIVKFAPSVSEEEIEAFNNSNGVEIAAKEDWAGWYVLRVKAPKNINALKMANLYYENPIIEFAVPNFIRILKPMSVTPDDTYFPDQWHLNNTGQSGGTPGGDIDTLKGWAINTGSSNIVIAIIDTGVDLTHPDLVNKLVDGWDCVNWPPGDNDPSPGSYSRDAHGTACAGLAAAQTNNAIGITGVAWGCKIMPVRVAYNVELGWFTTDTWLAGGIQWAADNGADILNNSWGGGSPSDYINNAIVYAKNYGRNEKGCVVVFSSGNLNGPVSYPATRSEVIAVGATDHNDYRWNVSPSSGSNYGAELDVVAPSGWTNNERVIFWATDISGSTGYNAGNSSDGDTAGNYYKWFGGTSAAAPLVAGLAGLILSVNPDLTSNEVQSIIESTADDKGTTGWDQYYGYGRINLFNALAIANTSSLSLDKVDDISDNYGVVPGNEITYTISYANPITNPSDPNYIGSVSNAVITDFLPVDLAFISASDPNSVYNPSTHTVTWDIGTLEPNESGSVTLTVKVNNCIPSYGSITNLCKISGGNWSRWTSEDTPVLCASGPSPTCGELSDFLCTGEPNLNLTWCPGRFASAVDGHEIYFGTNFNDVNNADNSWQLGEVYKGQDTNSFYPIGSNNLELGTTYYWRVDEVDTALDIRWKGSVWSFTIDCYLIDNFNKAYTSSSYRWPYRLKDTWKDNLTPQSAPVTRSQILYKSDPSREGGSTATGTKWSMEYWYKNTTSLYYSEARADIGPEDKKLNINPDWLSMGAKVLSLWFYGKPTNDANEQMYIQLVDGDNPAHTAKVEYRDYGDMNDIKVSEWQQWNIVLQDFEVNNPDINLDNVSRITIGFGPTTTGVHGQGTVYFEDIRLYLGNRCFPGCYPVGDFEPDCDVDFYDFAILASAWLTDPNQPNYNPVCDISVPGGDRIVNEYDLARLCDHWLLQAQKPSGFGESLFALSSFDQSQPESEPEPEPQEEDESQDDYQYDSMLAGPNETPGIWLVYDGNMFPAPGEEITVYIHSDPLLLSMGTVVDVVGDANITTAMSEADCNSFGWDNGWNSDPYIDPDGWLLVSGVSWECIASDTVGYFKFRYNSGEVTVFIDEYSSAYDANCLPVLFSPQSLVFGDPNQN